MEECYSNWKCASSAVPRGPVLGPVFKIYFNENITGLISTFAADTKMGKLWIVFTKKIREF